MIILHIVDNGKNIERRLHGLEGINENVGYDIFGALRWQT